MENEIVYENIDNHQFFRKYSEEGDLWMMQKINFIRLNGRLEELHSQLIQTYGAKVNKSMVELNYTPVKYENMIKRVNGE